MGVDKAEEDSIVALANAIVNPGAVMIEPFHALVTVDAVETPRRLNQVTSCADVLRIHRPHYGHIVHLRVSLEVTWIFETSDRPEGKTQAEKDLARDKDPIVGAISAFLVVGRLLVEVAQDRVRCHLQQCHADDHERDIEIYQIGWLPIGAVVTHHEIVPDPVLHGHHIADISDIIRESLSVFVILYNYPI